MIVVSNPRLPVIGKYFVTFYCEPSKRTIFFMTNIRWWNRHLSCVSLHKFKFFIFVLMYFTRQCKGRENPTPVLYNVHTDDRDNVSVEKKNVKKPLYCNTNLMIKVSYVKSVSLLFSVMYKRVILIITYGLNQMIY